MSGTFEHPPTCPRCKLVLEGYNDPRGDPRAPSPNDVCICIHCESVLVITDALQATLAPPDLEAATKRTLTYGKVVAFNRWRRNQLPGWQ